MKRTILAWTLCCLAFAAPALAEGWKAALFTSAYGPERLFAIDKESQTLFLLGKRSPIELLKKLPCTTGQSTGDKVAKGDMRTPEGIYFVGQKLDRGLDYDLYGSVAYTLNFPNPVDKIKGKSGSGIWIHGRGKDFGPRDTRGCVALKPADIKSLDNELAYNTPVVIAGSVTWSKEAGAAEKTFETLAERVRAWANDWQDKSERFFAHYDQKRFSISEGSEFRNFRAHKEKIFGSKPWIQVMVDNIRILQGPDYWVTWFDQYYRAPNLTSTVGKRFYWQPDAEGRLKIVGQEYARPSADLSPRYLAAKRREVDRLLDGWLVSWANADLQKYIAYYHRDASQGKQKGASEIEYYKKALWASRPPAKISLEGLEVLLHPEGLSASFIQEYRDAQGNADRGEKTLVLAPKPGGWAIVSEQWRRL